MENSFVEAVASSLVREFLSRKGLRKTSAVLEEELPRNPQSISNRNELRSALHLESLYKENKLKENPLKTLLEIITKYFLEHFGKPNKIKISGNRSLSPPKMFGVGSPLNEAKSSVLKLSDVSDDEIEGSTAVSDTSKIEIYRRENAPSMQKNISVRHKGKQPESNHKISKLLPKDNIQNVKESSRDLSKLLETSLEVKSSMPETQRPKSSRFVRGMSSGPITSSQEDSLKKRPSRRSSAANISIQSKEDTQRNDTLEIGGIPSNSASTALRIGKEFSAKVLASASFEDFRNTSPGSTNTFLKQNTQISGNISRNTENGTNKKGRQSRTSKYTEGYSSLNRHTLNFHEEAKPKEDLKLDDVEDDLETGEIYQIPTLLSKYKIQVQGKPIDLSQAVEIKRILFGSTLCCFSEEWKMQSFTFNNKHQLRYGFVQKKGGPCGVLAAVQGLMLKHLLFGKEQDVRALQTSDTLRTQCLCKALADILWCAASQIEATVALHSGKQQFSPAGRYKCDGILETLILYKFGKYEELLSFLQQNISPFENGPFGCILLILSAVLSRTPELVQKDFDVPSNCLIGAHAYCTQELVNLILCGRAVSNVFNDKMELDSGNGNITVLKGIDHRSEVGFLSLFEHYSVCQVGSYLKTPKYPIWLICSESHFSIMFCLKKELMNDWKIERKFDLYYYDGLANQQEEIRLTIDTSGTYIEEKDDDLIPPLEYCIRTKWKGAFVDWNGTEPIL
ncbi:probable ubiquitin carboxyl-terminal hydrolase MINDY-4 [Bombina bombina]|uniref:probable ubiquitin carboxyl-terminal hydrolase MINDY-4 n=1 Tax=Bombina bombina TaxID=8345 RepID=UPI00235AD32F|nr:probable ubiquitin carboxyl-terminal hydrolase MINDY-4 [Bombina bombina]